MKEGKLKRFWDRIKKYKENRVLQNNEITFCQQVDGDSTKTMNNQVQIKQNISGARYKTESTQQKGRWISNV